MTMGIILSRIMPATVGQLKVILEDAPNDLNNHYDEIVDNLFLGDVVCAKDIWGLEKLGITHILNTACGEDPVLYVDTDDNFYQARGFRCSFRGIPAIDIHWFSLYPFFHEAADFIESALESNGKIFVHCFAGVSRSATCVIVYLMIKRKMSAVKAVKLVRSRRNVCPNDGFLEQICQLDSYLRKSRSRLRCS